MVPPRLDAENVLQTTTCLGLRSGCAALAGTSHIASTCRRYYRSGTAPLENDLRKTASQTTHKSIDLRHQRIRPELFLYKDAK